VVEWGNGAKTWGVKTAFQKNVTRASNDFWTDSSLLRTLRYVIQPFSSPLQTPLHAARLAISGSRFAFLFSILL
jgi:hypothetical protein